MHGPKESDQLQQCDDAYVLLNHSADVYVDMLNVSDPKRLKEEVEVAILATPVRLNMNNFVLEKAFNMFLELNKNVKHIRFTFDKIKPGKAAVSINKTDIIIMTTNRSLSRTPYI